MALYKGLFRDLERYSLDGVQVTGQELGEGPYSVVVELEYRELKCAGKRLNPLLYSGTGVRNNSDSLVKKFAEECRLQSRLRHPNVVNFLGLFYESHDPLPMIVMELLPIDLDNCIEVYGILPEEISCSILYDVSLGLNYLHGQSPPIMHRNVSSNNILLTANMTAKISGLYTAIPDNGLELTQTPGNICFMPPEALVPNPQYDKSVDLFSFGVVMIHLFSGEFPMPGRVVCAKPDGIMIAASEAERFEEYLSAIGHDHVLMDLILRCISNHPPQRGNAPEIVLRLKNTVPLSLPSFANKLNPSWTDEGVWKSGEIEQEQIALEQRVEEAEAEVQRANKNKQEVERRAEMAETALQEAKNALLQSVDDAQRNADRVQKAERRATDAEHRLNHVTGQLRVANQRAMDAENKAKHVDVDGADVSPPQIADEGLRGMEVCAETTLSVTNSKQLFHWKDYGLKLCIPNKCLPAKVQQCTLTIKASLSGQYKFPEGSYLAISVEIEHCALKENTAKLNIVKSHCRQENLPYTFKKLGGSFTEHSSYGYIEVDSFSGVAVTQDGSEERQYCAGLYYLEKTRLNPEIHFVVVWDNEAHLTPVSTQYKSEGAVKGPHFIFSFESDVISLDIPSEGVVVSDVWRIQPLTPLLVTKKQVDSFKPRRQIPCCQMQAILARQCTTADVDTIPVLTRKVILQGARQPSLFLTISFIPSSNRAVLLGLHEHLEKVEKVEKPPLKLLLKELSKVADRWEDIGIFLDIDSGQLAVVKANDVSVYARLREMLKLWLTKTSPPPSWEILITAIHDGLGNEELVLDLQQKYIYMLP